MDEIYTPSSTTAPKEMLSKMPADLKNFWQTNNLHVNRQLLIFTLIYFLILTVFHWGLHPTWEIPFFLAGGLFGIIFLDLAEAVFKMSPLTATESTNSPFKNVLVQVVFVPLSFFVISSSGSFFGVGLVLSVYLSMLYWQRLAFKETGNFNSWFWVIKTEISFKTQQIYLYVMAGIFAFLSLLFV